ncbi:MAG: hypothetical protein DMG83_03410, partial [Acidobacteria bacterium]
MTHIRRASYPKNRKHISPRDRGVPRIYPVDIKGRAWITADKFQVVRIESEMISPLPEIQLLAEHQITEYGPVPFAAKNVELWLPKSVEVYLHFRGRRYYRRHTFER